MVRLLEKIFRQRIRRINSGLKAQGRHSQYPTHSPRVLSWQAPLLCPLCWAPAGFFIFTILWLCPYMPAMPPITNSTQAFHHPPMPVSFHLPPHMQDAHAQWFDPATRDHIYWLENLGSAFSHTARASWDFCTLNLPKMPDNDVIQLHPTADLQTSEDSAAWHKATCPNLHCGGSTNRGQAATTKPTDILHSSSRFDAVWRSTSSEAPTQLSGAVWRSTSSEAPTQFSAAKKTSQTLHYIRMPTPAAAGISDDAGQPVEPAYSISTGPATAMAIWAPFPAVGICPATDLPTAVVSSAFKVTAEDAMHHGETSTAVPLYSSTSPISTFWVNIFVPVSNSGSTAVATLLLSNPCVESPIYRTNISALYQGTAAAAITTSMSFISDNITGTSSQLLPSTSLHRSAAEQINMHTRPVAHDNQSIGMHISSGTPEQSCAFHGNAEVILEVYSLAPSANLCCTFVFLRALLQPLLTHTCIAVCI